MPTFPGVGATGGTTAYSTGTVVLSQAVTDDGIAEGTGGDDTLTGTVGNDFFDVSQGGDDSVTALAGSDFIYYGAAFTALDENDGGPEDRDAVVLQGNYSLTLGALSLVGIEYLSLQSGTVTKWGDTANNLYDYDITTVEANVLPGERLVINGQSLQAGEDLTFDGSAETDGGRFLVYAGHGCRHPHRRRRQRHLPLRGIPLRRQRHRRRRRWHRRGGDQHGQRGQYPRVRRRRFHQHRGDLGEQQVRLRPVGDAGLRAGRSPTATSPRAAT
jgi:hypothetical protein